VENWDELIRIRGVVSKALEEVRRDELIGSSLQAAVTVTPGTEKASSVLAAFSEHLEDLFIVSKCEVELVSEEAAQSEDGVQARVEKASGAKCVRCWHVRESVGTVPGHPQICHVCGKQLEIK
jgi:isoleucyl-tRNA synthetase